MFSNFKRSFLKFLTQDVRSESETKELAILLRSLNIIFCLYFIIISFLVVFLEHYILSLLLVFIIGLLAGSFICTYENKTQLGLQIFNLVIIFSTTILTLKVGWSKNYHWLIYVTILVVFFDLQKSLRYKLLYSSIITTFIIIVSFFAEEYPVLRTTSIYFNHTIEIMNISVFALSLTVSVYFFCATFMKSEEKIMQYNKKLIRMASVDALTNLSNRRCMNDQLKDLVYNYNRTGKRFCLAIGDVDLFKSVNDTYGHDTGDYVLVTLATMFSEYMDGKGSIARWGGEEFLFVFETDNIDISCSQLEQLRGEIALYEFHFKEHSFHITMTFGLVEFDEHLGIEAVISYADNKLYIGKENGRDQVVC